MTMKSTSKPIHEVLPADGVKACPHCHASPFLVDVVRCDQLAAGFEIVLRCLACGRSSCFFGTRSYEPERRVMQARATVTVTLEVPTEDLYSKSDCERMSMAALHEHAKRSAKENLAKHLMGLRGARILGTPDVRVVTFEDEQR